MFNKRREEEGEDDDDYQDETILYSIIILLIRGHNTGQCVKTKTREEWIPLARTSAV